MTNPTKIGSALMLIVLLAGFTAAVQKPAAPQAPASAPLVIAGADAVTAADAGGGYLTNRDILLVVLIVLAVIGLAVII